MAIGETLAPHDYHRSTKHAFGQFARSLGYLDWKTQPIPFRRFAGAPLLPLSRTPAAAAVPYPALFTSSVPARAISHLTVSEFLRCSLGLSAWKSAGGSRWALRVNPSSGNLHPTEAYLVWDTGVFHYAPAEHALEQRAAFEGGVWRLPIEDGSGTSAGFLVALSSIHWREAWKYGERAFRYCQHDTGHALGALRLSAAMLGWSLTVLGWSHAQIAATLGLTREADFRDAERETPELIALVSSGPADSLGVEPDAFVQASARAEWRGRANVLSQSRVEWPAIDAVAAATVDPGRHAQPSIRRGGGDYTQDVTAPHARRILLQRRSAVAFDPRGHLRCEAFVEMLGRVVPAAPPWDARSWGTDVHLVLFVHRVQDVVPGIYAFIRSDVDATRDAWASQMRPDFLWEPLTSTPRANADGLFLLAPLDVRSVARRVSCDQDIAGDGFFSLAMLARMDVVRDEPWRYRQLFWECGLIGQVLYLEAESVGARATGIGCFYDDPVHELLGLTDDRWQSLYHFSMGVPLDDARVATEPGYSWEVGPVAGESPSEA